MNEEQDALEKLTSKCVKFLSIKGTLIQICKSPFG